MAKSIVPAKGVYKNIHKIMSFSTHPNSFDKANKETDKAGYFERRSRERKIM